MFNFQCSGLETKFVLTETVQVLHLASDSGEDHDKDVCQEQLSRTGRSSAALVVRKLFENVDNDFNDGSERLF